MLNKSMQLNDTFCATMQAKQPSTCMWRFGNKKTKIFRYKQQMNAYSAEYYGVMGFVFNWRMILILFANKWLSNKHKRERKTP